MDRINEIEREKCSSDDRRDAEDNARNWDKFIEALKTAVGAERVLEVKNKAESNLGVQIKVQGAWLWKNM